MSNPEAIYETDFPKLKFLKRGKVRDIYDLGEYLLIVATDRLSAFDVVMPQPIPFKGSVLTQISNFWFSRMSDIIPNHIVSTNVDEFPNECLPYREQLHGRSVMVKKAAPLAIECVARGYLSGSGWNEYKQTKSVCGIKLHGGLQNRRNSRSRSSRRQRRPRSGMTRTSGSNARRRLSEKMSRNKHARSR